MVQALLELHLLVSWHVCFLQLFSDCFKLLIDLFISRRLLWDWLIRFFISIRLNILFNFISIWAINCFFIIIFSHTHSWHSWLSCSKWSIHFSSCTSSVRSFISWLHATHSWFLLFSTWNLKSLAKWRSYLSIFLVEINSFQFTGRFIIENEFIKS